MKRKSVRINFSEPLPWKVAATLKFGTNVTYITKAGTEKILGVLCEPGDQTAITGMLKTANLSFDVEQK